jgi:hypothetical protein
MVNRLLRVALLGGHVERVQYQLGAQVVCHCPADNSPTEGVEHDCEVEESGLGRHVGDVSHPQLVGTFRRKIAIYEVWNRMTSTSLNRRRGPFSPTYPAKTGLFHQTSDSIFANGVAFGLKRCVNPRGPVGPSRLVVDLPDFLCKHRILAGSPGRRSIPPRVVATGGNLQHTTHSGYRKFGLVRVYELEDFGGTSPVSRANQAVAFASISRSC